MVTQGKEEGIHCQCAKRESSEAKAQTEFFFLLRRQVTKMILKWIFLSNECLFFPSFEILNVP